MAYISGSKSSNLYPYTFLNFFIMDIFGVSGEEVSSNLLDHRILLILLAFASMLLSYFYLYKK